MLRCHRCLRSSSYSTGSVWAGGPNGGVAPIGGPLMRQRQQQQQYLPLRGAIGKTATSRAALRMTTSDQQVLLLLVLLVLVLVLLCIWLLFACWYNVYAPGCLAVLRTA